MLLVFYFSLKVQFMVSHLNQRFFIGFFLISIVYSCQFTAPANPTIAQKKLIPPFVDTLGSFATDSFQHTFSSIQPIKFKLKKPFKYIGKQPALITRTWTGDPHFICEYPKDILQIDSIYEITICFTYLGKQGAQHHRMGLELGSGERVAFVFKGFIPRPKEEDEIIKH